MAARKISISMDEDLVDDVQQAAEAAGMTVSAWIAEQARERIALLGWRKLLDDFQDAHGAFTEEELAAARADFEAAGFQGRPEARPAPRAS